MSNWYDSDNNNNNNNSSGQSWYSPNYGAHSSGLREAPQQQGKRKTVRIVSLILAACVLISCAAYAAWGERGNELYGDFMKEYWSSYYDQYGSGDSGSSDSSGSELPDDWHDYFEKYFASSSVSGKQAEIDLTRVEARGDLSLKLNDGTAGEALSAKQVYQKCAPSVVSIKGASTDSSGYSWGTGIIFSDDGYIVTNTHVIDGCSSVSIGLYDGTSYDAKLVGADTMSDIAVLKIEAEGLCAAEFAYASQLEVGDTVYALGNPLGENYRLTLTDGIISAISREVSYNGYTMNLLQTNTAINEGNSGGPLINGHGQVIGITNMKIMSSVSYNAVEGIGFAIPSDTVREMVDSLLSDGAVYGRSTIGITIGAVPEAIADYYDIPMGLYVSNVIETSDAAKQGVREADIITAVNGQAVSTTKDVAAIKAELSVGDTMTLSIWRDGKTFDVDILLMDATDVYK